MIPPPRRSTARDAPVAPRSTPLHRLSPNAPFRSVSRSTGDVQDLAAHERRLFGGEVQDRRRHVLRPAAAAHGYVLHHLLYELLEIQAETGRGLPGHLRLDKPGGYGVHRDAVAAELDSEGLGEALEARLGGRVVGLAAVAQSAGRGDVHYPAVSLFDHVPLRHPAAQKGPREVNVQDRPPLLVGHLVEEVVPGNTCVVDEDVEPAVALDRPLHGVLDLRAAGYVHAGREGVHAAVHERSRGLGGAVRLHVGQAHPAPLAGEARRRGASDAADGPSHQRNPALKSSHWPPFGLCSTPPLAACQHATAFGFRLSARYALRASLVSISAFLCAETS